MQLKKDIQQIVECFYPELYFSDKKVSCIEKNQKFPLLIFQLARRNSKVILNEELGNRWQYNVNLQLWTEWAEGCTTADEAMAAAFEEIKTFENYLVSIVAALTDPDYHTGNYFLSGNLRISHAHSEQTEHKLIGISATFLLNERKRMSICCNGQLIDDSKLRKIQKR